MAYSSFEALWGKKNQGIEMTEEQQDEPDSPSTQFDLTPHVYNHDLQSFN